MNMRRALFVLPFLFLAASAAEACSSSSSPASGGGDGGGGGGGTPTGECATLAACCANFPSSSVAQCESEAKENNQSGCSKTLASAVTAGVTCSSGSGSNSGSGSSPGTSGSGSSSSSGSGSSITSGSGSGGGGTCANPPSTPPTGFAPPTGLIAGAHTSCTAAEATGWGACVQSFPTTDAGEQACLANIFNPDGNINNCGVCVQGTDLLPDSPVPAQWGYETVVGIEPTLGDSNPADLTPVGAGPNFGACVLATGDAAGKQCGLDDLAVTACLFSVCLPLCPIPAASIANPTDTTYAALNACETAAASGACAQYINAEQTDCKAARNDAGTDPVSKCLALFDQDLDEDAGPPSTAASQAALIGAVCGGVDAGL